MYIQRKSVATHFYRALSITKLLVSLFLTVFQVHRGYDLNPIFLKWTCNNSLKKGNEKNK